MLARRLGAALLAAGSLGCAHATSYLDPAAPVYEVRRETQPPPAPPAVEPLRVVSFNIAYGIEVERALEVLRQSEPLRAPDVLALQEMDAPGTERIARALGMNAVYFPSGVHPKHKRDFGCALLSPWPLTEPRKLMLPHGARATGLRRAAVGATLLRGERRPRVYAVHLPAPFGISGDDLRDEVLTLLADADASPDPVVIAGDLTSHGLGEQFVKRGYAWLTRDVGASVLEMGILKLAFDHVFTKGMRPVTPGPAAGVVRDNKKASDHHPVWALVDTADPEGAAR